MSDETCTRVVLSSGLGFPRVLEKHPESEFDLSSGLGFSMSLDKYPEGHGRAVSSPGTPSESYGKFASKSFHLDTFPIRIWIKQFSSPAMLPQSSGAGRQAGQANLTDIRLVHFYVCRMDVLGCRRAWQSDKTGKLERGPFGTFLCVPNGRFLF